MIKLHSAQIIGIDGEVIDIEIDLTPGIHSFSIVGLADKAVEESKDRIGAAIKNFGGRPPKNKNHRITVSLAPADLKKEGPVFDLPIALAFLLASGQTNFNPAKKLFLGELALDGSIRAIKGALSLALASRKKGFTELYVPKGNGREAALSGTRVYEVSSLKEAVYHLEGKELLIPVTTPDNVSSPNHFQTDFSDIRGQESAKRALEIAAAGNHNIALSGPPGSGKTLLAKTFSSILPSLSREEVVEITKIHSISGSLSGGIAQERPFRSPHHTASHVALVGGGNYPRPGEITLAHRGVLFLDEFPEFDRRVIEALRQPLEDGIISVSRAKGSLSFPANITLIAAMNPCPCGNFGNPRQACICPLYALEKYTRKLSGPVVDRIDLWIDVDPVDLEKLRTMRNEHVQTKAAQIESSTQIRKRVEAARSIQKKRFAETNLITNSDMGPRELEKFCPLGKESEEILQQAARSLGLSARSYHKVIKIARTIADIVQSSGIGEAHILEALQYRPKSRNV